MPANHFVHFEFPHRMNKDGTIDSVCPRCFVTIGCSTWEADLDRMEAAHVCESSRLNSFNQHRRMPAVSERLADLEIAAERTSSPARNTWTHRGASSRRSA
jgi:hypothetical protein